MFPRFARTALVAEPPLRIRRCAAQLTLMIVTLCAAIPGTGSSTCSLNKSGAIQPSQLGYGVGHSNAAPLLHGGVVRLWNGYPSSISTAWLYIETAANTFNWSAFTGTWLPYSRNNNVQLDWVISATPNFWSSKPTDTSCGSHNGSCDAPVDWNTGNGHLKKLVRSAWKNNILCKGTATTNCVRFVEIWNEPNSATGWNQTQTSNGANNKGMLAKMTSDLAGYIHTLNPNLCVGTGAPQGYSSDVYHGAAGYMNGFLGRIAGTADIDWVGFHGHIGDATFGIARPPNLENTNLSNIQSVVDAVVGQPFKGKPMIDTEFAVASGGNNDLPDANGSNQAQFVAQDVLLQQSYVGTNNPVIATMWYNPDDLGCGGPCADVSFYTDSSLTALNTAGQYWNEVTKWITGTTPQAPCTNLTANQWTCAFVGTDSMNYLAAWDSGTGSNFNTGAYTQYTDINDTVYVTGPGATINLTRAPVFLAQK
jgi:hypothetical protein